jgi:hypothetical protein
VTAAYCVNTVAQVDQATQRAYLSNVCVATAARRQGIAAALMTAAEDLARSLGTSTAAFKKQFVLAGFWACSSCSRGHLWGVWERTSQSDWGTPCQMCLNSMYRGAPADVYTGAVTSLPAGSKTHGEEPLFYMNTFAHNKSGIVYLVVPGLELSAGDRCQSQKGSPLWRYH